jgi:hypothetical protein
MINRKGFWLSLCLLNLSIVAALGLVLRNKILFPISFIDYRNLLSAHSHFAFSGWVGFSLMTLFIYELLPPLLAGKKSYQWLLGGVQISSFGMVFTFPFVGYSASSIFFSTLYIFVCFAFAWIFIKDLLRSGLSKSVRLVAVCAMASLVISAIGPFGLAYILITKSGDSLLYRDSIYTFLHFQYNGFFTLGVFALFFNHLVKKGMLIGRSLRLFALLLCLSVLPALFLSLLWHNSTLYYGIAGIACILIVFSLFYFFKYFARLNITQLFSARLARTLWVISFLSFALKMLLNVGTIVPQLGNAVYGDRPVIIGFLHLVFLGFVSFFILSHLIESGFFSRNGRLARMPFYVFLTGVLANEALLMLQGLQILFKTNSYIYNWLLWIASILLFLGASMIAITGFKNRQNKKAIVGAMA